MKIYQLFMATCLLTLAGYNPCCAQSQVWIQWLGNRPQFELLLLLLIVVLVGGGSIMAGTALAAAHFSPGTMVFAAEPELADDAVCSFREKRLAERDFSCTQTDGLKT